MVKVKTTPVKDYSQTLNDTTIQMNSLKNIPEIPSRMTVNSGKTMVIQVVLGITVFLAAGAVLGGPLAAALTSSTTTANSATTSVSTVSTTVSSTTVATTTLTAALAISGPQLNFNISTLTGAWSLCYSALYSAPMYPNISSILSTCYKSKLLLGCRPVGNVLLTVAAMGNRADVLFNCSASNTLTHQANGVGWYFSMDAGNWNSWGFVLGSNSVLRNNCDGDMSTNPAYRLCWHLVGTVGGWRCGSTGSLDNSMSWEKVIYHAM